MSFRCLPWVCKNTLASRLLGFSASVSASASELRKYAHSPFFFFFFFFTYSLPHFFSFFFFFFFSFDILAPPFSIRSIFLCSSILSNGSVALETLCWREGVD